MRYRNHPKTLPLGSHTLNLAGAGKAPRSTVYIDLSTGRDIEVYPAYLKRVGPHYGLASVPGNRALESVRVERKDLVRAGAHRTGEALLIGNVDFKSDGPLASLLWKAPTAVAPPPVTRPRRLIGVVSRVHPSGRFGEITAADGVHKFFVHDSEFRNQRQFRFGTQVRFSPGKPAHNGKLPSALDVAA